MTIVLNTLTLLRNKDRIILRNKWEINNMYIFKFCSERKKKMKKNTYYLTDKVMGFYLLLYLTYWVKED